MNQKIENVLISNGLVTVSFFDISLSHIIQTQQASTKQLVAADDIHTNNESITESATCKHGSTVYLLFDCVELVLNLD